MDKPRVTIETSLEIEEYQKLEQITKLTAEASGETDTDAVEARIVAQWVRKGIAHTFGEKELPW